MHETRRVCGASGLPVNVALVARARAFGPLAGRTEGASERCGRDEDAIGDGAATRAAALFAAAQTWYVEQAPPGGPTELARRRVIARRRRVGRPSPLQRVRRPARRPRLGAQKGERLAQDLERRTENGDPTEVEHLVRVRVACMHIHVHLNTCAYTYMYMCMWLTFTCRVSALSTEI